MIRLMIPTIGMKLRLLYPWRFTAQMEDRNANFIAAYGIDIYRELGLPKPTSRVEERNLAWTHRRKIAELKFDVALDPGTVLCVDRVYIRKGQSEFDSLTFIIDDSPDPRFLTKKKGGTATKQCRFFASLSDVNGMECEIVA